MENVKGLIMLQEDYIKIFSTLRSRISPLGYLGEPVENGAACTSFLELLDTTWKRFADTHEKIRASSELSEENLNHEYFIRLVFSNQFTRYFKMREDVYIKRVQEQAGEN